MDREADGDVADTYRFYAYNAQCRHIFLCLTHDNGYCAELARWVYDKTAGSKTTLVHGAFTAKEYGNIDFPTTKFDSVFETTPIPVGKRRKNTASLPPPFVSNGRHTPTPSYDGSSHDMLSTDGIVTNSYSSVANTAPAGISLPLRAATAPSPQPFVATPAPAASAAAAKATGDPKGIPVNRSGQRVDLRLKQPSTTDIEKFEARISYRKLCNEHHLRGNCYQYNCKFDHDPIDDAMRNTLRYKARSLPCQSGMRCRRKDCYFGHQCPWGNDSCSNPKCTFQKAGLHDITDLEVCKFVAASPA